MRGSAIARSTDRNSRLAHYDAGTVVAPKAAFGPGIASEHMEADGVCRIAVLTAEARNRLEQEAPALALRLDRYIMACSA